MRELLVAILLLSVVVATSLTLLSVSAPDANLTGDSGETPPHSTIDSEYPGKEQDDVNVSSVPEAFEDFPTDRRYVSKFHINRPPKWVPEDSVLLEHTSAHTFEVTRYPDAEPTSRQLDRAWRLYNQSYNAAVEEGYFNLDEATSRGFERHDSLHFGKTEYYFDNETLNPRRPESLVYYSFPGNESDGGGNGTLAGYMYITDGMDVEGNQVGGPLTVWHYHPRSREKCFAEVANEGVNINGHECEKDDPSLPRTPEMIHVWFIEHPGGPFSSNMAVPKEYIEPRRMNESEFKDYAIRSFRNRTAN